nr:TonB-dependent receptor [uncultured Desulfobacter sp.]
MKIFQAAIVFISILITINQSMADSKQSEISLDTLTVTANKQEENIQDVPMSITAFDELTLEDKNITSLDELTDYVPNLIILDQGVSGAAVPSMRGINAGLGTFDVATALFVDGVPILSFAGYEDTLLNIERVEVLRGPQGTLYGRSAQAGAINIISRQPDNEFRGKISVDGGEDNKKEVSLSVSGPIIQDKLFIGLSGQHYDKDGFIKNGYTGDMEGAKEHWYGKGQLRWTPTDDLDINLIVSRLEYDNDGFTMGLSEDGASSMGVIPSGDREVYSGFDTKEDSINTAQALKISYDFNDALNLSSITTHNLYEEKTASDWDFNPADLSFSTNDNEYESISQELRLASNAEKMNWVAGLFYYKYDNTFDNMYRSSPTKRDMGGETYALFGQLRYALTDKLGVTGGLRYEHQDKDFEDYVSGRARDNSWDDIAPKFSVDYGFTSEVMGYVTVAKGFRPGGFNLWSTAAEYDSYDSEEVWSYEIGAKGQFLENRLIVNIALFYLDRNDMQVSEKIPAGQSYITNAATINSYGAELEVQAKITPHFSMTSSVGYINAEFDDYEDYLGDYNGNKVTGVPDYTFSIGGQYRADNGFYTRVDLTGVGSMYIDKKNEYKRDAYQLINAQIGYEAESWDIYLYGKNIFDEDYSKVGATYITYSDPREIGVKLTYRF